MCTPCSLPHAYPARCHGRALPVAACKRLTEKYDIIMCAVPDERVVLMNGYVMLAVFAVAAFVLVGCVSEEQPPPPPNDPQPNQTVTPAQMTQKFCEASSGRWNECGAPAACRDPRSMAACPAVCMRYCECGTEKNFGCPAGYVCTDKVPTADGTDTVGICKPAQ